jgi:hypothetical protein
MSILLGSTGAQAEREILTGSPSAPVAERLAAIRSAVSDVFGEQGQVAPATEGIELLAWKNWANFGWPSWSDWKNKWKDWNNNWHNGWNNWGNNWKNWGNGWHNY